MASVTRDSVGGGKPDISGSRAMRGPYPLTVFRVRKRRKSVPTPSRATKWKPHSSVLSELIQSIRTVSRLMGLLCSAVLAGDCIGGEEGV